MLTLVDKYIPYVSAVNDKNKPWFNKNLRTLRNKKKRLYCNAKNRASESSWSKYKGFLSEYTVALRTAKDKYFAHDLPSLLKSNPRKFWQTITPNHSFDISLLDDRQQPLSDAECSSVFNTFFTSVFTREDHSDIPVAPEHDYPFMAPINISVDGIACLINELKKTSACGIDDINTKLLKTQYLFQV